MKRAVTLALLVALPAWASDAVGPPCEIVSMTVKRGMLISADSGVNLPVFEGQYQDEESARCLGRKLVRLEAQLAVYEKTAFTPPTVIVVAATAFVVGAVSVYVATR